LPAANPNGFPMVGHARAASIAKTPDTTKIRMIRRVHEGGCALGGVGFSFVTIALCTF
jgi:hypothetical protein